MSKEIPKSMFAARKKKCNYPCDKWWSNSGRTPLYSSKAILKSAMKQSWQSGNIGDYDIVEFKLVEVKK